MPAFRRIPTSRWRTSSALLETADLVVCSSQQLLEHAAPHAKRTALVRNGVDYDAFARVPGVDHARRASR